MYSPSTRRDLSRADLREVLDLLFIYVLVSESMFRDEYLSDSERNSMQKFYMYSHLSVETGVPRNDVGVLVLPFFSEEKFRMLRNYNQNMALVRHLGKFLDDLESYFYYRVNHAGPSQYPKINRMMENLQHKMAIQNGDYISLRRIIEHWEYATHEQRAICSTRLLQAVNYRPKSGDLELEDLYTGWVKRSRYKLKETYNAELEEPVGYVPQQGGEGAGFLAHALAAIAGSVVGWKSVRNK